MKENQYGRHSKIIGKVIDAPPGRVYMETLIGSERIIDMLAGEPLPRIC